MDKWSSHMEKGVVMDLIVIVIGVGDNMAETGVFCSVFQNVKFQVLDLEVGLDKSLENTRESEEE